MDLDAYTCRVPGCKGPRSGVCINGLSFDECPDVIPIEDAVQTEDVRAIAETLPNAGEMVQTGGVSSLDAAACDALLRARGGTVVGVVAGPEVGKTTMIATMYELIHRGRMPAFRFAGSETLRGYEERCHLARMASNGVSSDTPRTPTSAKLSFTHLRLATSSGIKDVIFSDRSGEHFDNVLASPSGIVGTFTTTHGLNAASSRPSAPPTPSSRWTARRSTRNRWRSSQTPSRKPRMPPPDCPIATRPRAMRRRCRIFYFYCPRVARTATISAIGKSYFRKCEPFNI